jgi:hypothetical protein
MALPIQTNIGQPVATPSGVAGSLRSGNLNELIVQELHGRYAETTLRRAMFAGANTIAVATTAGFATTYTGLCLSNPAGSPVNLVLNKVTWAAIVAQASALSLGIMTGYTSAGVVTHTTPAVPASNFVGAPAGVGLLDAACTLPIAPTRVILLDSLLTGAITVANHGGNIYDLEGSVIIPPGGFAAFYTSAASAAASLVFGMQWEEVPTVV